MQCMHPSKLENLVSLAIVLPNCMHHMLFTWSNIQIIQDTPDFKKILKFGNSNPVPNDDDEKGIQNSFLAFRLQHFMPDWLISIIDTSRETKYELCYVLTNSLDLKTRNWLWWFSCLTIKGRFENCSNKNKSFQQLRYEYVLVGSILLPLKDIRALFQRSSIYPIALCTLNDFLA